MSAPSAPAEVESLNFEDIGVRWTVRSRKGERRRFPSLRSLREALSDGSVHPGDELSFDGAVWRPVRDIPDLRAYFWEVFKGVKQGRIRPSAVGVIGWEDDGFFEDDAPTTLIRPDHFLQTAIQESLARELAARVEEKNLPPFTAAASDESAAPPPASTPKPPPARSSSSGRRWLLLLLGGILLIGGLLLLASLLLGGVLVLRA